MKKEMVVSAGLLLVLLLPASFCFGETVAFFKFDSIKGSNFTDDTGHDLLGTLGLPPEGGAPDVTAGPSGKSTDKAVKISTDKELIVDDATLLNLEMIPPLTIECWVKSPGFTIAEDSAPLLSYGGDSGGYRLRITIDGFISFVGADTIDTDVQFPFDNAWHHLAFVDDYDTNQAIFYLDGKEVFKQDGATDTPAGNIKALYIGKRYQSPNNVTYSGELDRVRISNKALKISELDTDPANPKAVASSTVLYLDFDEGKLPYVGKGTAAPVEAITLQAWSTGNAGGPEIVSDTPSGLKGDFALKFDGTQIARVEDPNHIMDVGGEGNDWTLEAWVKYEDTTLDRMIIFYYGPGAISFSLSGDNPRNVFLTTLRIRDINSSDGTAPAVVEPGSWHHVAVAHVYGEGMTFYVDGEEISFVSETGGARKTEVPRMNIGSEPNGVLPYNGWIDRIRISNVALKPTELDSKAKSVAPVNEWSIF